MRTAGISELKASLSEYLDHVKAGEEVVVTDRGRPVARIVPIAPAEALPERLLELARQGVVRLGTGKLSDRFWELPRPADPEGLALKALLEERREGR